MDKESIQSHNIMTSKARRLLEAIDRRLLGTGQELPYSTPGWHLHSPDKTQDPGKSAAEKWAARLRSTQKSIYLKKAIMQSGPPKLTPSQQMALKKGHA